MALPFAIVQKGARTTRKNGDSKKTGKPYDFIELEILVEDGRGRRQIQRTTYDSVNDVPEAGEYDLDLSYLGFIRDQRGYETLGLTKYVLTEAR